MLSAFRCLLSAIFPPPIYAVGSKDANRYLLTSSRSMLHSLRSPLSPLHAPRSSLFGVVESHPLFVDVLF